MCDACDWSDDGDTHPVYPCTGCGNYACHCPIPEPITDEHSETSEGVPEPQAYPVRIATRNCTQCGRVVWSHPGPPSLCLECWRADPMVQPTTQDRHSGMMQTATGRMFYPLDPRVNEIDPYDIAHGLAFACRYAGHCRRFYSVAEHCYHVSSAFTDPALAREAMIHDSAEAYMGDMIRPMKHTPEMTPFRTAEARLEKAINVRFAVESTMESHAEVKHIDDRILMDETEQLMMYPQKYKDRMAPVQPLGIRLKCWSPERARRRYLSRMADLFPQEFVNVSWWRKVWWRYG